MSGYMDNPNKFDNYYDTLSAAQQNIVDEIIARHELTLDEFTEIVEEPQYYREEEKE